MSVTRIAASFRVSLIASARRPCAGPIPLDLVARYRHGARLSKSEKSGARAYSVRGVGALRRRTITSTRAISVPSGATGRPATDTPPGMSRRALVSSIKKW